MTIDHSHYGLLLLAWVCLYSYSSINQKFIALAFMVHPNDTYNTCENHNTPYNAFHDNEQIRFVEIQNRNLNPMSRVSESRQLRAHKSDSRTVCVPEDLKNHLK